MPKVTHTPGPWVLDPNHPLMIYCNDPLGSRIADLSKSGHGIPLDTDHANTRLIVEAPELYDCLVSVLPPLRRMPGYKQWLERVDECLARIRGETHA